MPAVDRAWVGCYFSLALGANSIVVQSLDNYLWRYNSALALLDRCANHRGIHLSYQEREVLFASTQWHLYQDYTILRLLIAGNHNILKYVENAPYYYELCV